MLLVSTFLFAQQAPEKKTKSEKKKEKRDRINEMIKMEEEGEPAFHKQSAFGFKLNTDGWGISYEIGKIRTITKATVFQIEFNEKKHPKEEKQSNSQPVGGGFYLLGNPFIYGKKNIFYQLKLGVGQQIRFGGKGNKNGVAVYGIVVGGFSAGLLRPYYIEVSDSTGENEDIKYTPSDSALFLSNRIIGGTGLAKGWGEMKFVPGLHLKTALRFDYNRFNYFISAIEVGFNAEYYFKEVDQMVLNEPKNFFLNAYISLLFGKRK